MYRIDVRGFQDSNGDGVGDLRGVASRMDYLQALGVDAILLDHISDRDDGFDEVVEAAVPRQIRVLVTLEDGGDVAPRTDADVAARGRMWLTRGASGIFLHTTRTAR